MKLGACTAVQHEDQELDRLEGLRYATSTDAATVRQAWGRSEKSMTRGGR
jgi:hypothetical protein